MNINVIAVDDEINILEDLKRMLGMMDGVQLAGAFISPLEALKFAHRNKIDAAVLDINMPELNGIELAEMFKDICPDIQIIFATGYDEYALAAHHLDAMGYLLKPYTFNDVSKAMDRVGLLLEGMRGRHMDRNIEVRCFGKFDIIKDGQPVFFKYNKAKELFAILVDARGGIVSMEHAITLLWEDREYDTKVKGLYRKAVSMMRAAFREAGCEDLCLYYRSSLAVNIKSFYCDYYEFMKGDAEIRRSFFDNYMTDYSWAEETNAMLHNVL